MISRLLWALFSVGLVGPVWAKDQGEPRGSLPVLQYLGARASRMEAALPPLPDNLPAWESRRAQVQRALAELLGLPAREPMRAKTLASRTEGDVVVEDVIYLWAEHCYVPGIVVRPVRTNGRLPALVVPPGFGGSSKALDEGYYKPFVIQMARNGYVILFFDDPSFGDRRAPLAAWYAATSANGTQGMGIQVFDTLRGLDFLLTRQEVDPARIGVAGLCQGSEQAWLAAALEDRFQIAVPVCGTTTFTDWARMPGYEGVNLSSADPHLKSVLRFTDWPEIGACIAPRPLFIASNSGDNWWPEAGYNKVVSTVQKIYQLYGKPERFAHLRDLRSHSLTPYLPELSPWIDLHLKALPGDATTAPQPCGEASADADLNPLRYLQRQIVRKVEALPERFSNEQDWHRYRLSLTRWLREACVIKDLHPGAAICRGSEKTNDLTIEKMVIGQDQDLALSVKIYQRSSAPAARQPALILSYADGQSATCPAVMNCIRAWTQDGYLVAVPEHASTDPSSSRPTTSVVSLYGAGDTTGLSPMAMRVWDDLAALRVLRERSDVGSIGVVGLGAGGADAAITAALDEQVAAVAAVGAITVRDWIEKVAPNNYHIMPYLPDMMATTDWQYIYSAALPRPVLIVDATDRANWPAEAYFRVQRMAEQVALLQGAAQHLTFHTATSPWGVEEIRDWLKRTLPLPKRTAGQAPIPGRSTPARGRAPAHEPVPVFTTKETAAYQPKGPADCFRQISLEYNSGPRPEFSAGRAFEPAVLENYFSQADAVAYAEFCQRIHLSGVLLLAVPQGGYTTYLQTKVGEPYPYLKSHDFDFLGRVIQECHRRNISVFGYLCIGWNFKAQRDFPEEFPAPGPNAIPTLNGRFGDQVIQYARELLSNYPIDGLRTDILDHNTQARSAGDLAFYRERYGEEMPQTYPSWEREQDFRLASISRFVRRFHEACKQTKPAVPIWHNWFNYKNVADLREAGLVDIAYEEFADPFSTLFVKGLFGTRGMISGKLLQNPQRRLCLALGGRAYDYFPVDRRSALPTRELIAEFQAGRGYYGKDSPHWVPRGMDWFDDDLAPFYAMVEQIEPYLVDADPVSPIAIVFSEASRFRFPQWSRGPVVSPLKGLCEYYLGHNEPVAFLSSFQLPRQNLARFKVLVVPDMGGMKPDEMHALTEYARHGGQVLLTGEATLHDESGRPLANFAMAEECGLDFVGTNRGTIQIQPTSDWNGRLLPREMTNVVFVTSRRRSGHTLASLLGEGKSWPLIHVNPTGTGRFAYVASNASRELTTAVIDYLRGPQPVVTSPPEKQVLLTRQAQAGRWILHLIGEGDYDVFIRSDYAAPKRVAALYPTSGWRADLRLAEAGAQIEVRGEAHDRLAVLE
jgi:dienelactone hydrolase